MVNSARSIPLRLTHPWSDPCAETHALAVADPPATKLFRDPVSDEAPWIYGPENALTEFVANQVSTRQPLSSPITFHGVSGSGKTMLLTGLASECQRHTADGDKPSGPTILVAAVDFARRYADAVETNSLSDFRDFFRRAPLVAIDALEKISSKETAQNEIALLIDECRQTTFFITMDDSPVAADYLVPRLASRLSSGLVVPISSPSTPARLALIQAFALDVQCPLPETVATLLASDPACQTVFPTPTELRHLVQRLKLLARNHQQPIDQAFAHRFLASVRAAGEPTMQEITRHVGRKFQLKVDVIRGKKRQKQIARARACAIYLTRQMTEKTLQQIGAYFGDRDHTTVMHACKKIAQEKQHDEQLRQCVDQLADHIAAANRLANKS